MDDVEKKLRRVADEADRKYAQRDAYPGCAVLLVFIGLFFMLVSWILYVEIVREVLR